MTVKIKTQVLILGSGPGGYSAAFRCSDLGIKTTIIERYPNLGGVCLNVGCIPSKSLLHISKLIKSYENLNKYEINTESKKINLDLNKIHSWKNNIINRLSRNLHSMARNKGINVIHGFGRFIDNHNISVSNHENDINTEIQFHHAIIATGSNPISLPLAPKDQRIWNSTDALSLQKIPKKLLIIGSGAIGLEMATIYSALGSKIDIVEMYDQIMPILDSDVIHMFSKKFSKNKNINFITNTKIKEINNKTDYIDVIMKNNNENSQYTNQYDSILIAIGRTPNTGNLNLEKIGINVDNHGFIIVNKQMKTNKSNIFAIGDVIGHPMLAHKSMYEGYIASEVIFGKKFYFDAKVIPSIIYSDPEIAWVGCTETEAKSKKINYEVVKFPWTGLGKAIISDSVEGITKLLFDKNTHKILGGLVLGNNASEIIGEIALAIEMGCDSEDIMLTIHAHPTVYESISFAASMYTKLITI